MDHRPQAWGRPRDDVYGAYDHSYLSHPKTATQSPAVTGTSVLGIKFADGVVLAADNLASYGSLARYPDVQRLQKFGTTSVIGVSGDVSDMQYIFRYLKDKEIEEQYDGNFSAAAAAGDNKAGTDDADDDALQNRGGLNAMNLHTNLKGVMYGRRNKGDPLWNHLLVAGFDNDRKPYLAFADLRGTVFTSPSLATGFGAMLAQPIMRKYAATEEDAAKLTKEDAVRIIQDCMKVMYYRDARSMDEYSLAVVTKSGVEIDPKVKLEGQNWAFADRIKGYGTQEV